MRVAAFLWLAAALGCTGSARDELVHEEVLADPELVVVAPPQPEASCPDLGPSTTYPEDRELSVGFIDERSGSSSPRPTVEPGMTPAVRALIHSHADRGWRRLPMPTKGSAYAAVEPSLWWHAYVEEPGSQCARAVPEYGGTLAFDVDMDWRDDVIRLRYREHHELDREEVARAWTRLDFSGIPSGTVRAYLHYAYTAGKERSFPEDRDAFDPGPMKGHPPFEVVSAPLEVELLRPLALELTPRADRRGPLDHVSDLVTLRMRNIGHDGRFVAVPEGARLRFEVMVGDTDPRWLEVERAAIRSDDRRLLAAGDAIELVGRDAGPHRPDALWIAPEKGEAVRLRAYYQPYVEAPKQDVELRSEWVTLEL
jgi:hypothetical protein